MSVLEILDSVLGFLEEINGKLDRLLASGNFDEDSPERVKQIKAMDRMIEMDMKPKKEPTVIEKTIIKGGTTIPKKGQGKYVWFPVKGLQGVKVRACSNEGCPYYLKYSEEKGKYEHWKYDPNTQEGGYVQDNCDHYFPEGT